MIGILGNIKEYFWDQGNIHQNFLEHGRTNLGERLEGELKARNQILYASLKLLNSLDLEQKARKSKF